jgi:mono/diheme cytochrome c family protein
MFVRVLFPVIAVVATSAPAWAGEGDASRGAAYANAMCASCHSVSADKATSPNVAAPPFRDVKLASGEALAKLFNTTHPNTARLLKDTQADDILSYIESLNAPGDG